MENLTVAVHFLSDTDDTVRLQRRELHDISNFMDMPTNQFVANFRVSKHIFNVLLTKFESESLPTYRSTYIRGDVKMATFLNFLATGGYQQTVGNEFFSSVSKASVCSIIAECLNFFEKSICKDWIKIDGRINDNHIKQEFFRRTGFPGIIGCVDGSHIRIKSPGNNVKHLYYNRKGYYSINIMVVCDHNTHIMYVDGRHPGANHDAFVWEHSFIEHTLKSNFENGQKKSWVLGDAGYKLKPYLITPFRNRNTLAEKRYNKKHTSARNVVKRCFGVLKNRFRCIIGSRGLHYEPKKETQIVNVCCALHNMCLFYKCEEPDLTLEADNTSDNDDNYVLMEEGVETTAIRYNIASNI